MTRFVDARSDTSGPGHHEEAVLWFLRAADRHNAGHRDDVNLTPLFEALVRACGERDTETMAATQSREVIGSLVEQLCLWEPHTPQFREALRRLREAVHV